MSRARSSTRAVPRASRHWSAASGTEPKRASARVRASAGLRPSAMCFCVSRSIWNASSSSSSRSTRRGATSARTRRNRSRRFMSVESWCRMTTLIPTGVDCQHQAANRSTGCTRHPVTMAVDRPLRRYSEPVITHRAHRWRGGSGEKPGSKPCARSRRCSGSAVGAGGRMPSLTSCGRNS